MKEFDSEVQFLIDKSIRRGAATWGEITRLGQEHGECIADAVSQTLDRAGVCIIRERDASIIPQANVLLNSLKLVELVSLCLQLPMAPKTPRRLHQHVLKQRSYELDLKRLEYLDADNEWYYLSPPFNSLQRSIRRLFNSGQIPFGRDWTTGDRKTNLNYLQALIDHPAFVARILPKIRQHYLSLRAVGLLVAWIQATGELMPTMAGIIRAGLEQDGSEIVRHLLLSDQPSTAESVLKNHRDVCYSCPPSRRCQPLREASSTYDVLMEYRSTALDEIVRLRHPKIDLRDCLLEDWLLAKFFLPYSLVVTTKRWMLQTSIVSCDSIVLDKSHGRYCPWNDVWALKNP
jgi:hypothetical protein